MARSSWKGYLRLSLVSVPVKGYTANTTSGDVRLNQLHETCHSRIKYQKTCPLHGEVSKDEIVSGYEVSKGQFVVIDDEEIKALKPERERVVTVQAIVAQDAIDPVYFTDKTYYLLPDGKVGQRPYALIQKCLADDQMQAVGQVVLYGREELVVVRPVDRVLEMTALKYEQEVTDASGLEEELETPELKKEEIDLTKTLLAAFEKRDFSIADFKDHYVEKLTELIEAKAQGKEIAIPPPSAEPNVINLMDALKKSVAAAKGGGASRRKEPEPRIASRARRKVSRGRRKTG
jgi:DNA end-binding protein Ku